MTATTSQTSGMAAVCGVGGWVGGWVGVVCVCVSLSLSVTCEVFLPFETAQAC
jgi:hypothetical protein